MPDWRKEPAVLLPLFYFITSHEERAGDAQPGEERTMQEPRCNCTGLEGSHRKDGDRVLNRVCGGRRRGDGIQLQEVNLGFI